MNKRQTGTDYERQAGAWLETKGYRIMEYNFRSKTGEIDLIARDGRYLVFVEVKYRQDNRAGSGLEAVDCRKQKRISRTAGYYLVLHQLSQDTPCRFDVVSIEGEKFTLIKNAFYYR